MKNFLTGCLLVLTGAFTIFSLGGCYSWDAATKASRTGTDIYGNSTRESPQQKTAQPAGSRSGQNAFYHNSRETQKWVSNPSRTPKYRSQATGQKLFY